MRTQRRPILFRRTVIPHRLIVCPHAECITCHPFQNQFIGRRPWISFIKDSKKRYEKARLAKLALGLRIGADHPHTGWPRRLVSGAMGHGPWARGPCSHAWLPGLPFVTPEANNAGIASIAWSVRDDK